jgi:peroxiredoxin
MKLKKTFISLFAIVMLFTLGYLWFLPTGLKNSPDIKLVTLDGVQLQLASLRGKPLLVTFWATTCPSCIKEMPHLIELYEELSPRGLEIVGIAMDYDPPNHVLAMRNAKNIPYPIALDINAEAARAFGNVRLTPTSFLIAPDGRVVYQKLGAMSMQTLRQDILDMLQPSQASQPADATIGNG